MGNGLNDVGIGFECAFKNICSIACNPKAFDIVVVMRILGFDLLKEFNRVFDRVAFGKLIDLEQQLTIFVDQYGF